MTLLQFFMAWLDLDLMFVALMLCRPETELRPLKTVQKDGLAPPSVIDSR